MKKTNKALLLVLCAILLVAGSVMGTLAYLTSQASVENTFTAGNVTITLDEAKVDEYGVEIEGADRVTTNKYKLIPGHSYTKDPTVTVGATSEDCYIFVEIVNGLGTDADIAMNKDEWILVNGSLENTSVWVYGAEGKAVVVTKNGEVTPFETFTFGENANPANYDTAENEDAKITVTAYAIQADTLNGKTPAEIWALFAAQ